MLNSAWTSSFGPQPSHGIRCCMTTLYHKGTRLRRGSHRLIRGQGIRRSSRDIGPYLPLCVQSPLFTSLVLLQFRKPQFDASTELLGRSRFPRNPGFTGLVKWSQKVASVCGPSVSVLGSLGIAMVTGGWPLCMVPVCLCWKSPLMPALSLICRPVSSTVIF